MTTPSAAVSLRTPGDARPTIVLASENQGKLRELRALVGDIADVHDLAPYDLALPEETGETFAENACAKAEFVSAATGLVALADDSGLEVDALDGLPGVRTARYAGEGSTDAANRQKLLAALAGTPDADRGARFVSFVAIARPGAETLLFAGTCDGAIGREERGDGGFGYDCIFLLPDGRTMAELSADEKNAISHRGHAMRAALPALRVTIAGRVESEVP
ncbi:MAG TPA: RdgB/HAM1 family non-canonical purine NTP pyrophosphatase [Thermomicrobiales bacterium]|nr:RdgB/HAM1 family non-canonical purine NTP pyrophosphatase [Thermomicrobiales bacterium]